jgi:hypothetical protein
MEHQPLYKTNGSQEESNNVLRGNRSGHHNTIPQYLPGLYFLVYKMVNIANNLQVCCTVEKNHFCSNVILYSFHVYLAPESPAYEIYISLLIQYSRACDYLERGLLLTRKLLNQGFLEVNLK